MAVCASAGGAANRKNEAVAAMPHGVFAPMPGRVLLEKIIAFPWKERGKQGLNGLRMAGR
ncbi:hypothetical protein ADT71_17270 [Novosphingobium sp. ST904]|nr:hypothetical protein ADT71_17270 [Novosphingobium sp. ST904]